MQFAESNSDCYGIPTEENDRMENSTTWLLLAGIGLSVALLSGVAKKTTTWIYVAASLGVILAWEFLRGLVGGEKTTPEEQSSTPTPPKIDVEKRADALIDVVEAEVERTTPADSIEEFRKRREEDGI